MVAVTETLSKSVGGALQHETPKRHCKILATPNNKICTQLATGGGYAIDAIEVEPTMILQRVAIHLSRPNDLNGEVVGNRLSWGLLARRCWGQLAHSEVHIEGVAY